MRRSNQDKIVAQIYLRDWSMKAEILRKAQMYEDTMHRKNDCTSNNNEIGEIMSSSSCLDNGSNENIKLYAPTLHCNRSGIYLEKGTETSHRATATSAPSPANIKNSNDNNNNNNNINNAVNGNKLCDNSASVDGGGGGGDESLKFKSNKIRRNKKENVLRMRKYKDIFNMIKPMIAIDKL